MPIMAYEIQPKAPRHPLYNLRPQGIGKSLPGRRPYHPLGDCLDFLARGGARSFENGGVMGKECQEKG